MSFHPTNGARSGGMFINFSQPVFVEFYSSNTELNVETTCEIYDNFLIVLFAWSEIGVAKMVLIFLSYFCVLLGVPCDLSIGSTETKYIKLNTKTQFFSITFNFCIYFKRENFFGQIIVKLINPPNIFRRAWHHLSDEMT